MKLKALAAAVAAFAAMSSANAFFLYPGATLLEDDNREYLIKGAGNTAAGTLQVGDKLRGVVEFKSIEQIGGAGGSQSPILPELTAIFETEIKSIIDANADGLAEFIFFGPSASFTATYGAGAMVALFQGGTNLNINSCASIAACETAATDGAHWATVGFGDLDDQWMSRNADLDFGAVAAGDASTKYATVNYALSILVNNTGYSFNEQALKCVPDPGAFFLCAGDGKTDVIGSGDVLGGELLTNGYKARSDIDVKLNVIPEPGTLALVGAALLGVGFGARRRKA